MANLDVPHISSSGTSSTAYNLAQVRGAGGWGGGQAQNNMFAAQTHHDHFSQYQHLRESRNLAQVIQEARQQSQSVKEEQMSTQRRLVQVFIADPDENVPLDKSLIYSGEQKLTDATNEELFHEIEISKILKEHNAYRVTLTNKKVKERAEFLEPARIRDLRMVVVEIAKF